MGRALSDVSLREANRFLKLFGITKVLLIFLLRPKIIELSDDAVAIRMPLTRISRNHLKSMYFGALAVGADVAGGFILVALLHFSGKRASFAFKDVKAEFHKRADGDVVFRCADGRAIRECVERAEATGERQNTTVRILATVPEKYGQDPVATFDLTLSTKFADRPR